MRTLFALAAMAALTLPATNAAAQEGDFLTSLEGSWTGGGTVMVRTDSKPVKVSCSFDSNATATSLSLDGNCRGLVIVSRAVGADLKVNGGAYSGTYTGSRSGPAALKGSRKGNAINMGIRWGREINGDRDARLTVEKVGENGMRITTVDVDPASGDNVVTSRIDLKRS